MGNKPNFHFTTEKANVYLCEVISLMSQRQLNELEFKLKQGLVPRNYLQILSACSRIKNRKVKENYKKKKSQSHCI